MTTAYFTLTGDDGACWLRSTYCVSKLAAELYLTLMYCTREFKMDDKVEGRGKSGAINPGLSKILLKKRIYL